MLNKLAVYRFFIFIFIFCMAGSVQSKSLIITNTNIKYEKCMHSAPVVQVIKQCNNANVCWGNWLYQYEKAMTHQTACIKAYGGNDYSYHYSNKDV